ncbi:conjugal transfer protein [Corticibacter populi]|uniref:Conjugal transfer protein n=1 Tax=Corticibacter populi TaxID=1550736 RepID=A0A3M6QYP9_9BURK|nr:RAQPRD family integrative conjugative element protein [Corticibacter populi]RMX08140.1 conjugal transfer protein [Corticibacter populi]RZS35396.1 RAQPRD family integrative conjugative element protein [Corticibacter populi]
MHAYPSRQLNGRAWLAALLVAAAGLATPAFADNLDAERERLAVIDGEITMLKQLVAKAQASAPSGQRVKFHYEWLIADLEQMQQGIRDHLNSPRQPRPVPALHGDYRQ